MHNNLTFITGLSGAGMSSVLKVLEDLGYEVLDNFPLALLDTLLRDTHERPIALGIDSRTRDFNPQNVIAEAKKHKASILYVDCDEKILQRRFSETRRVHPMARDRTVADGIVLEQKLIAPLKKAAATIIDTSDLSVHDLRRQVEGIFDPDRQDRLGLTVMSFGFKHGIPREADMVMDVRFLKNPHWDAELRPQTGKDEAVGQYIESDAAYATFFENLTALIEPLLPRYTAEGKNYLTIAIGCTGGRHRSVYLAEALAGWLEGLDRRVHIKHRDLKE